MTGSRYPALVSLVVALGGFLMGFDSAVISGVVDPVRERFDLDADQLGWTVSCLTLGATLAMAGAGPLADRLGRKPVLLGTALLFTVSAVTSALATTNTTLVLARILGGFGVGGALLVAPIYIAEIAPPEKRGQLVSFNQLNIVLGFSAAFFSNYFLDGYFAAQTTDVTDIAWRWMLGVEAIPAALYFLLLFAVPKSPRWLAMKGRDAEARVVLARVNGEGAADAALADVKAAIARSAEEGKPRLGEVLQRRFRYVMVIGLGLGFFQQATGINAVFYYSTTIFAMTGAARDVALSQAIWVGLVNVVFTLVAMRLIDRAGRRPLLLVGTSVMTAALLTNSWAFSAAEYELPATRYEVPATVSEVVSPQTAEALRGLGGRTFADRDAFLAAARDVAGAAAAPLASEVDVEADALGAAAAVTPAGLSPDAVRALEPLLGQTFDDQIAFLRAAREAARAVSPAVGDEVDGKAQDLAKAALRIDGTIVLLAILAYIAAFAISLGPVMWAMFSEIFPMRVRGVAISIAGFFNSAVSFTVQQLFPRGMESLGPSGVFLVFASFAGAAFLFSAFLVPETKGRSLEELEAELIGRRDSK